MDWRCHAPASEQPPANAWARGSAGLAVLASVLPGLAVPVLEGRTELSATRQHFTLLWLVTGALAAVTVGCAARAPGGGPTIGASVGRPVYNLPAARAEIRRLPGLL